MSTPVERNASLTVGSVDSVSPSDITVLLDPDAPQATALNTGTPTGFPRINGYVLIPNEAGAVVGLNRYRAVRLPQAHRTQGLRSRRLALPSAEAQTHPARDPHHGHGR